MPADHLSDLLYTFIDGEFFDPADSSVGGVIFIYKIVRVAAAGNLVQMSNSDNLVVYRHILHHFSHLFGNLAGNTGVDLVENNGRQLSLVGEYILNNHH